MERNDEYTQFPQKNALRNIKIMYLYPLERKVLSRYFLCKRHSPWFGSVDLHFSRLASVPTMEIPAFFLTLVLTELFLGARTFPGLLTTCK